MSKETPAQQFNKLARQALGHQREIDALESKETAIRRKIDGVEDRAIQLLRGAIGFDVEDVVVDEFGNRYRITSIGVPSLYWGRVNKIPGLTKTLERVHVKGLLLNKSGVPSWSKERDLHGKLKRVQVEE